MFSQDIQSSIHDTKWTFDDLCALPFITNITVLCAMRSILAARFKMVNFGRERRMERVQLAHQKSTEALIPTLHALFFPWVVSTPAPYSSTFQDLPRPLINGVIGSVEQVELNWMGNMDTFKLYAGIAVKLESDGHKAPRFASLTALGSKICGLDSMLILAYSMLILC